MYTSGLTWGSYVMSTGLTQAFLETHFFIWMRVDGMPADPCKIKNIRFQKYHDSSVRNIKLLRLAKVLVAQFKYSSSLRPGTKAFTCGKWINRYNFGIDDGEDSKFGTDKELIVLNILKYKHCVNNSRDVSRDHFAKKS